MTKPTGGRFSVRPLSRHCWRFVASVASQQVWTRQNTLKRMLPPRMERAEKHSRRRACVSPRRRAKSAPQKSKNRPVTNRNQSAQRASRSGIRLSLHDPRSGYRVSPVWQSVTTATNRLRESEKCARSKGSKASVWRNRKSKLIRLPSRSNRRTLT